MVDYTSLLLACFDYTFPCHGLVNLRREGQSSDMASFALFYYNLSIQNLACINNKATGLCKHIKQKTVNVR